MKVRESLRISWRAITGHKLRSTLTTLGVVIGVGSVIAFMVFGGGFKSELIGDIEDENEPLLVVSTEDPSSGTFEQPINPLIYTQSDVEQIRSIDGVEYAAPSGTIPATQIQHGDQTRSSGFSVQVASPGQFEHDGMTTLRDGEPFGSPNETVVDERIDQLFEENVTVGDELTVTMHGERRTLTVSGVVEQTIETNQQGVPVYVSTDHYRSTVETPDGDQERAYAAIQVRAASFDDVDRVQTATQEYLDTESDARELKDDDHEIRAQTFDELVEQATSILDMLTYFIVGIAALSLLVGSIGIANIMIVSVTERTREIGIMKAIGARKRDVVQLFLVESVIIGTIGATVGVVLGLGGGYLLVTLAGFPMDVPLNWILTAVAVGIAVGVVSGIYPAWRGARVDPIEALRTE